jgi:hypothetical protein
MDLPFWGPTFGSAYDLYNAATTPYGGVCAAIATAASVTGAAIATTTAPALYNPPNSGKTLRVMSVRFGDVSGTIIRSNLRYYWLNPTANGITLSGTTQGTINVRTPKVAPVAQWLTALTVGSAASIFVPVGFGSGGAIAAQFYSLQDNLEGSIITVNPGELFYPFASNAAYAGVTDIGIAWFEVPILTGN